MSDNSLSRYSLRLPSELKASLEKAATANGYSLNAEIINRLNNSEFLDGCTIQPISKAREFANAALKENWPKVLERVGKLLNEGIYKGVERIIVLTQVDLYPNLYIKRLKEKLTENGYVIEIKDKNLIVNISLFEDN